MGSDLQHASRLAERMIREFGMSPEIGQIYLDEHAVREGALAAQVNGQYILLTDYERRVAQYEQAGRQDLADAEKREMAILSAYLPQQLGEDEIAAIVAEAVAAAGAKAPWSHSTWSPVIATTSKRQGARAAAGCCCR